MLNLRVRDGAIHCGIRDEVSSMYRGAIVFEVFIFYTFLFIFMWKKAFDAHEHFGAHDRMRGVQGPFYGSVDGHLWERSGARSLRVVLVVRDFSVF